MELLETLHDIVIREGFEKGRSLQEVAQETGLSVVEVLQRGVDLKLIPASEVPWRLQAGPH